MVHPSVGSTLHPTHSSPGMEAVPSPSLHRALESLMVNLDDEILRYRHSRTGQGPMPTAQRKLTFRARPRSSPSLIHLNRPGANRPQGKANARGASVPRATSGRPANPLPANNLPANNLPASHLPASGSSAPGAIPGGAAQPPTPMGQALAPYMAMPDAYLESTAALLGSAAPGVDPAYNPATYDLVTYDPEAYYPEEADPPPSLAQRLSTPLGVGALLLLLVGSAGFGYVVTSPTALDHLRNHPWMARFQTDPDPAVDDATPPEVLGEVPTGLQGIGPDLSGQELGRLDLDRVSRIPVEPSQPNPRIEPTVEDARGNSPDSNASQPPGDRAEASDAPSASESPRVTETRRPEAGVPLTPSRPSPTTVAPSAVAPGAARSPVVPQNRPTPPAPQTTQSAPPPTLPASPAAPPAAPPSTLSAAPPSAPNPGVPPAINVAPPQPLGSVTTVPTPPPALVVTPPPPLAPPATPPAAPSTQTNYYVVTDYTGSQSLESARSVVSEAYVRNFQGSAKIQMGAFSQESSARDLIQQLQRQGIPAQVYNQP